MQRILIKGLVQGVFFRAATKRIADQMQLKGFVRNLPDGSVEICLEGSREDADRLIKELKKEPEPKIHSITIQSKPSKNHFSSFDIIY